MRSNRSEVMEELRRILRRKNKAAAIAVQNEAKRLAPVGTPESTGIEGYRGGRLRDSITHDSDEDGLVVGTNLYYAPYVHNGTYDHKIAAFDQATGQPIGGGEGDKGMKPRPFLVDGLMNSAEELRRIYSS